MLCSTSTNLTRGSRSHGASSSGPSHSLRLGAPKAGTGLEQAVAANTDTLQWYEQSPMFYSNYPLDRAPALRKDPALLQQLLQLPAARTMLVAGRKLLVQSAPGTPAGTSSSAQQLSPVWFESPSSYLAAAGEPSLGPLFLGLDPETSAPCFAIQVKPSAEAGLTNEGRYSWAVARNAGPSMCAADAALAAVATGLAQWNLDARYHGSSGKQTVSTDAGFSRTCEDSGRAVYPRIDPAIITLVTAGSDWCLLGRKEGWPTGR
jgi:NAD+ diphosphatase